MVTTEPGRPEKDKRKQGLTIKTWIVLKFMKFKTRQRWTDANCNPLRSFYRNENLFPKNKELKYGLLVVCLSVNYKQLIDVQT